MGFLHKGRPTRSQPGLKIACSVKMDRSNLLELLGDVACLRTLTGSYEGGLEGPRLGMVRYESVLLLLGNIARQHAADRLPAPHSFHETVLHDDPSS